MKQMYPSVSELANALLANNVAKQDFVAPAPAIVMHPDLTLSGFGLDAAPANALGHSQLADYLGIPKAYYDRMKGAGPAAQGLLAEHVNHWLTGKVDPKTQQTERRMVRTLNGTMRALLSDRYQRIDNFEVADVSLDILRTIPDMEIVSSAITESRLYIKAVSKSIVLPVAGSRRVGDLVEAGVIITNSEVGLGSVSIQPFANFLACLNGMVRNGEGLRANHVGRKIDASLEGLLSDGTKRLEDAVVLSKVRDVMKHAFDAQGFRRFIDRLEAAIKEPIAGDVPAAVEALGPTLGLGTGERQSVLRHLIEGGDLSRYGLMNAITRTAHDVESYDRATELEAEGFKLLQMPQRAWESVSNAKPLLLAA